MRTLLDVNVILALIDSDHVFHTLAHTWWNGAKKNGWASCPLTENGVVRIMSHPNYAEPERYSVNDVITWLGKFVRDTDHEFWADDISLLDTETFNWERVHGPKQLTDIYLLGLACKHQGMLVTFDRRISLNAVRTAESANLAVI